MALRSTRAQATCRCRYRARAPAALRWPAAAFHRSAPRRRRERILRHCRSGDRSGIVVRWRRLPGRARPHRQSLRNDHRARSSLRLLGDITTTQAHRDADISLAQGRGVVDPVASHSDDVAASPQHASDAQLRLGVTRAITAPSSAVEAAARSSIVGGTGSIQHIHALQGVRPRAQPLLQCRHDHR